MHCFEPSPELITCIELNLNQFSKIFIKKKAICDISGNIDFYINAVSQQTKSLVVDSVIPFCEGDSMSKISIESDTLDQYCVKNNISYIDVLKVDIQGAEQALLRGATKIINNTKNAIFEISFLDSDIFETSKILLNKFDSYKVVNEVKMGADIIFFKGKVK